jgi:hypothetical protein
LLFHNAIQQHNYIISKLLYLLFGYILVIYQTHPKPRKVKQPLHEARIGTGPYGKTFTPFTHYGRTLPPKPILARIQPLRNKLTQLLAEWQALEDAARAEVEAARVAFLKVQNKKHTTREYERAAKKTRRPVALMNTIIIEHNALRKAASLL